MQQCVVEEGLPGGAAFALGGQPDSGLAVLAEAGAPPVPQPGGGQRAEDDP